MLSLQTAVLVRFLCSVPAALADGPGSAETTVAGKASETLAACDWAEIREVYEADRHRAFPVDAGHRARNPGQQWSTLFDGRGFTTTPDTGGWSWGLELVRYGWGTQQHGVELPRSVSADGGRVAYEWDHRLSEWYINGPGGLEHGFTVEGRPRHADGPLVAGLEVRGDLLPFVSEDGRDVRFQDAGGKTVLTYTGLAAYDAGGRALAATWKATTNSLELLVDDENARYPLTIDPIAQQAYLKASNTEPLDLFGRSVSVSGDTVVVGSIEEDSNATGVNGDEGNNLAPSSGAAYVFVRNGASWSQEAYLKASNTQAGDFYGGAVSISGDTIVVAAAGEDSQATGVNGNQSDDGAPSSGAAYVFVRNGTSWSQEAYLKASNTGTQDRFGESVSIFGDTIVVGAGDEDSNATGVNGDGSNNLASSSGAAYVFFRNGASWSQEAYLKASNAEASDFFGQSVSISGHTIVVGALGEDSDATGVNGSQDNDLASGSGAAYVFARTGTMWSQVAFLKASNTQAGDKFGHSVSICTGTVVVGR